MVLHDDLVADGDVTGQLGEDVGAAAVVQTDALEPTAAQEDLLHSDVRNDGMRYCPAQSCDRITTRR